MIYMYISNVIIYIVYVTHWSDILGTAVICIAYMSLQPGCMVFSVEKSVQNGPKLEDKQ